MDGKLDLAENTELCGQFLKVNKIPRPLQGRAVAGMKNRFAADRSGIFFCAAIDVSC